MDQKITAPVSSQTASTALQPASGLAKSGGKGVFAKLIALIESKSNADHDAGTEKLFKPAANTKEITADASVSDSSGVHSAAAGKAVAKKNTPEQKESSDLITAEAGIEIRNSNNAETRLIASNRNLGSEVAEEKVSATLKIGDKQAEKIADKTDTTAWSAATGTTEAKASAPAKADINLSAKGGAKGDAAEGSATRPADMAKAAASAKANMEQSAANSAKVDAAEGSATRPADMAKAAASAKANMEQSAANSAKVDAADASASRTADAAKAAASAKANMEQSAANGAMGDAADVSATRTADMAKTAASAKANMEQSAANSAKVDAADVSATRTADMAKAAASAKANMEQPAKIAVHSETAATPATHGDDTDEVAASSKVEAARPARSRTRGESVHVAATHVEERQAAATPGRKSNPSAATKAEKPANEPLVASTRAAMQQMSNSMQPEKGMPAQTEAIAMANLPEQQRASTNSFVKIRKINLEHASRAKTSPSQANASQIRQPAVAPSESFTTSMKEIVVQGEGFSRPAHHAIDTGNSQMFQIGGQEATSSLTRSFYQPNQQLMGSTPVTVAAAMQQVGQAAGQGKFQLELTLTPEHLGKVQVFLDSDVNKQIQVHFVVEQSTSRQSIEQHLPALRQALADQGLNMDSFSMESSEQHQDNRQAGHRRNPDHGTMTAGQPGSNENRPEAAANGRLSIRI